MTDALPARLYLASASPRRRELLTQIGLPHAVLRVPAPPGEDEPQHPGESAADYVRRTARDKAERGRDWLRAQSLPIMPLLVLPTLLSRPPLSISVFVFKFKLVKPLVISHWVALVEKTKAPELVGCLLVMQPTKAKDIANK